MMSVILNDANNWQTSYHAGADDEDGGHHWWILIKKHCDFDDVRHIDGDIMLITGRESSPVLVTVTVLPKCHTAWTGESLNIMNII